MILGLRHCWDERQDLSMKETSCVIIYSYKYTWHAKNINSFTCTHLHVCVCMNTHVIVMYILILEKPSCAQATPASTASNPVSHTVFHDSLTQISRRPEVSELPISLRSPVLHVTAIKKD